MPDLASEAIAFLEPGRVALVPIRLPEPGPDDVVVRTLYSGLSLGTERHYLTGRYNRMAENVAGRYPFLTGYQNCGVVEWVGSAIDGLAPGFQVILSGTRRVDDTYVGRGAHCRRAVLAARDVWRVPPIVDPVEAALFVLLGVGMHGTRLAAVGPGELIAMIGQGMIGQMVAQSARRRGARVIASDLVPERVALSRQHSADLALLAPDEDLAAAVQAERPDGADVAIDTTGIAAMFPRCLELIRREGRISMQGYYPDPIAIDFHPAHVQRATVIFPCAWDDTGQVATALAEGWPTIAPLVTHRVRAAEAPALYDLVLAHPDQLLGAVIDWSD
jgi:2-desacetyl-2-hydroxyethyl bacteriochlorophyllide A dehydrogenase